MIMAAMNNPGWPREIHLLLEHAHPSIVIAFAYGYMFPHHAWRVSMKLASSPGFPSGST
jgi:hypothetical protein